MLTSGRIAVTGATGFLGGVLCHHLRTSGAWPIAIGRDVAKLRQLDQQGFETHAFDLFDCDPHQLVACLSGVDAVVHAAALSSPWGRKRDFEAANVHATKTLLAAASLAGVDKFVLVSTPSVYFRFQDQLGITEDHLLPAPVNEYARTKRIAEELVAASPIREKIILRPRGLYGKGDSALLPRLLLAARAGPLPHVRDGAAVTDITHVDDVADAITALIGMKFRSGTHVYNISGGETLRLTDIITQACRMNGIAPRWRKVRPGFLINAARALEMVHGLLPGLPEPRITAYSAGILTYSQTLDIAKAERELGWRPKIGFEEGLRKTFGQMS